MLKNAKAKGARRELQAKRQLRAEGFYITKAGGSLGAFDLCAICKTCTRMIQIKSNRWPDPAEREQMRLTAEKYLAPTVSIECWRYRDGCKTPDVRTLADFNGLEATE